MNSITCIWTQLVIGLGLLISTGLATPVSAQKVRVQLSSREAYVGMPIVLQLTLNTDTSGFTEPDMPEIDGCTVRAAGPPSTNSQIMIINGRRSESRSVTMQYLITPQRAGAFTVPAFEVAVDGQVQKTKPQKFVATKSETGDLLFVEVEGSQPTVFVGEPLELTLKIWIKPFTDRQKRIRLTEGHMWQLVSESTAWGSFAEKIRELSADNRRPAGREVLRDDGQGEQGTYYLYEISATVYPRRPGKIDTDDVQIVVNYPTALGKSRDPFDRFFRDSLIDRDPFGANSPLRQMMDDNFFGSNFGSRLTISAARPIAASADVDSTEVLPIPTENRPADYRGAIGQYRIVTQATPNDVAAGDPIRLNIGVTGNGPMDLVQAPPLAEISELTTDFKVNDEPLAGFVQDEAKVFTTTIRPRRKGISQIPAIPFSFFDPATKSFETVYSQPISINVRLAETLSLDQVEGAAGPFSSGDSVTLQATGPNFENVLDTAILSSEPAQTASPWLLTALLLPPLIWLGFWAFRLVGSLTGLSSFWRSPRSICARRIRRTDSPEQVMQAIVDYVARTCRVECPNPASAIGAIRQQGWESIAIGAEQLFDQVQRERYGGLAVDENALTAAKTSGLETLERLHAARLQSRRYRIRQGTPSARKTNNSNEKHRAFRATLWLLSLGCLNLVAPAELGATESMPYDSGRTELNRQQQEILLSEAGQAYQQAQQTVQSDSATAKASFASAAEKYQLLIDSGIRNSALYRNLGNANLNSGELGQAIAAYECALHLDPTDDQARINLNFARSQVQGNTAAEQDGATVDALSWNSLVKNGRFINTQIIRWIGFHSIAWTAALASILFWGILILRASGVPFRAVRLAIAPGIVLAATLLSIGLMYGHAEKSDRAIIIADQLDVRSGDGEKFETVYSMSPAQGHAVRILDLRNGWARIETESGQTGWAPQRLLARSQPSNAN